MADVRTNPKLVSLWDDVNGVAIGTGANPLPMSVSSLPLPTNSAQETGGNLATVRNRFAPSTGNSVEVTASGDTLVYTPTSGKSIRLKWIGLSTSPSMLAATKVQIKFNTGGTPFYEWWMGAPGAFAHGVVRESNVNDKLYVNCSVAPGATTPLLVNVDIEEF